MIEGSQQQDSCRICDWFRSKVTWPGSVSRWIRRFLALIIIAEGTGFGGVVFFDLPLTTSYRTITQFLSLPLLSLLFWLVGFGLLLTEGARTRPVGRLLAGFGVVLLSFALFIFSSSHALSAALRYGVLIFFLTWEVVGIDDDES